MKFVKKLLLVFIMMFAFVAFTACGDDSGKTNVEDLLKESVVVNFDTQGGSTIEKATVKLSDVNSFTLPADPTREGYAFIGWYLDSSYATEFKNLEAKAGEITLYAKWETVTSTSIVVKFETNGGSQLNNVVVNALNPDLNALSKVPTKAGFVFVGWYLDKSLTKVASLEAVVKAIANKEVTLYAKWEEEGKVSLTSGMNVNAEINVDFDIDIAQLDKHYDYIYNEETQTYEDKVTEELETTQAKGKGKVTIDCSFAAKSLEKFEDLGLALVLGAEIGAVANGEALEAPALEFKLYLADGALYVLVPAALMGSDADFGVKLDLVKVYEDNIETVKEQLEELIAMLDELPEDALPEGFDLSVLDRIDLDDLKVEDLLGLIDLLPEEYRNLISNPDDLTTEAIFDLLDGVVEDLPVEITAEELDAIEALVDDILEILKGLLPSKTENGATVKYELTDKQVKDTIDALAAYVKENINDIFALVMQLSASSDDDEDVPAVGEDGGVTETGEVTGTQEDDEDDEDGEESGYDLTGMVGPMIDQFLPIIKAALKVNEAYVQYTTNGLFPTNVNGVLDFEVAVDGSDFAVFGMDAREHYNIKAKATLDVNAAVLTTAIAYPDFTAYMDVTEMVSELVAEKLDELFNGGEHGYEEEMMTPDEMKAALEALGYTVMWVESREEGVDGVLTAILGADTNTAITATFYSDPVKAEAAYDAATAPSGEDYAISLTAGYVLVVGKNDAVTVFEDIFNGNN